MMPRARQLFALLLLLAPLAAIAEPVTVQNLRVWRAPEYTRLVFDVSAPVEHRLFQLSDPDRVVIDLDNARLQGTLPEVDTSGPLLAGVRLGGDESNRLRVVLDLKAPAHPRSFLLKPAGPYGNRLVIDLYDVKAEEESAKEDEEARVAERAAPQKNARREFVVAIDAGHGGEDPGAIGRRYHTREKDVTLAIARELARRVAQEPGMRPVLIRDGDYYVGLRSRFMKARRQRADVFVSIHADAVPGRGASGSSVYALSERGATSAMARFLADSENASDLIGGVTLNDKDDMLRRVLVDLSNNKTMQYSLTLGNDVLAELARVGPVHLHHVAQAGFAVLKSPDVPSVLVETAFISNPSEEKKLRTPAFQRRIAEGIFRGIKRYLDSTAPPPAPVQAHRSPAGATLEHVVRRGETLTSIAQQYNVNIDALRFFNDLRGNVAPVGAKLLIPLGQGDG
jgi:N-acetylmuramoyl-L-alanine amidase